jgi:phosphate-selective porin OprO and OprP
MKISRLLSIAALFLFHLSSSSQSIKYDTWGKGVRLTTKDSTGSIQFSARIQNLLVVDQSLNTGSDPDISAMTRRARLKFQGFAVNPKITYKIELGLSNRDISNSKESALVSGAPRIVFDAVVKYKFAKRTSIWFGQTKLPGNRERVISSQNLQFVDRSALNSNFNLDRDFGFQLHNEFKVGKVVIRPILAISTGEGRNITAKNIGGLDYTGRIEVMPFGSFTNKGDYFSSDLEREETPKISFGFTGDYNQGSIRQAGQLGTILTDSNGKYIESDLTTLIADMIFKYRGFSVLSEFAYRENNNSTAVDAAGKAYAQGFAYSGQVGYLFPSNVEIAARYTRIATLSGKSSSLKNNEQYTLGMSKYIKGHNLKIQTDLTYDRALSTTFANERLIFRLQTELSF